MGRPTSYKPEYADQARALCELGATDDKIADFFKTSIQSIHNWKSQFKPFFEALKVNKGGPDDLVERSLYQRAIGYTFDAEEIFCSGGEVTRVQVRKHIPPDTTACIFWLKNRRRTEWRDVHRIEHVDEPLDRMTDQDLIDEVRRRAKDLAIDLEPLLIEDQSGKS